MDIKKIKINHKLISQLKKSRDKFCQVKNNEYYPDKGSFLCPLVIYLKSIVVFQPFLEISMRIV